MERRWFWRNTTWCMIGILPDCCKKLYVVRFKEVTKCLVEVISANCFCSNLEERIWFTSMLATGSSVCGYDCSTATSWTPSTYMKSLRTWRRSEAAHAAINAVCREHSQTFCSQRRILSNLCCFCYITVFLSLNHPYVLLLPHRFFFCWYNIKAGVALHHSCECNLAE